MVLAELNDEIHSNGPYLHVTRQISFFRQSCLDRLASTGEIVPSGGGMTPFFHTRTGLDHPLPTGMQDLLPPVARFEAQISRSLLECIEACGYDLVGLPALEYLSVAESAARGSSSAFRFIEAESGEVIVVSHDMTAQVARLVSTRFGNAKGALRLAYQGSVLRRRHERARRQRQMAQVGFELIGEDAQHGDKEVIGVSCAALRRVGLKQYTVDLSHASILGSYLKSLEPQPALDLREALLLRDRVGIRSVLRQAEISAGQYESLTTVLSELSLLSGGLEVFTEAAKLPLSEKAKKALTQLEELSRWIIDNEVAPKLHIDLGELRSTNYYTGSMFQILAPGPGEAIGGGGRYDRLLQSFGEARAAAGFAFDVGNLRWALEEQGASATQSPKLHISGSAELADSLRALGLRVVLSSQEAGDPAAFGRMALDLGFDAAYAPMLGQDVPGQEAGTLTIKTETQTRVETLTANSNSELASLIRQSLI